MKRLISILSPFFIIAFILYILIDFRHVEELSAEEKQAIKRYRQELVKGTLLTKKEGIFYQADFDAISKSLDLLHQHDHYFVFGPEWGTKLANPQKEFVKVETIINKPIYANNSKNYAFFQALRQDLAFVKQNMGTRQSHDVLDDLSTLVFTKEIIEERQWSNAKTIQVMKDQGLKLIKEDQTAPAAPAGNPSTSQPN